MHRYFAQILLFLAHLYYQPDFCIFLLGSHTEVLQVRAYLIIKPYNTVSKSCVNVSVFCKSSLIFVAASNDLLFIYSFRISNHSLKEQ